MLALLGRVAPFAYASANECLSEVAELGAVNEDLGPHGPVRPGHGGLSALGDFDPQEQDPPPLANAEVHSAPGSGSDDEPMSEASSRDVVLETPPPSPH